MSQPTTTDPRAERLRRELRPNQALKSPDSQITITESADVQRLCLRTCGGLFGVPRTFIFASVSPSAGLCQTCLDASRSFGAVVRGIRDIESRGGDGLQAGRSCYGADGSFGIVEVRLINTPLQRVPGLRETGY